MATTSLWHIKGRLKDLIDYVENPEKTAAKAPELQDLYNVFTYVQRPEATQEGEYVTAINCLKETALRQMILTKKRYGKTDGYIAWHGYQSFKPEEVTPQLAHEIGVKLAKELWGDRFEIIVTTHLDKEHLHCHFCFNSVSFRDGGKYNYQQTILEKYAQENGFKNTRVFIDDGWSGTNFARPAFTEIMELAEKGLIGTLIVKDHSRLGRNRLIVGQLLEEGFDSLGVRYIAIMDNIDTAKGISDLVPIQDLFNEWHAKNTSQKVRNVFKSKGMSGAPLTTNPPFGYLKDPESKNGWIIDEAAAKTVRQIFAWCVDGLGPTQIAKRLKAAKVPTPTEHWSNIGRNCSKPPAVPYNWCSATVADILGKQEYCGDTVNFRSTTKSFKNKKKIDRPPEKWQIFKDTHPAIIDRETFALVQELRKHRRRPTKSGIVSPFSGLLYCADCGEKLYYSVTGSYKREQAYFFCSSYRKNSEVCSAHYIREKVVEQIVLESMQRILLNVQAFEKEFARKQMDCYTEDKKKLLAAKRRELGKVKKRIAEIDTLIQKIYEDNASGKLSDERYATLSLSYEEEQKTLKAAVPEMQVYLETETDKTESLQRFIQKVKQITELKALTPELIHEFVDKIVVYAPRYLDGKRVQLLDIYYSGVGILHELNPEEMEEAFQQHLAQRNKEKTA